MIIIGTDAPTDHRLLIPALSRQFPPPGVPTKISRSRGGLEAAAEAQLAAANAT